jgi:hypothetical protein
MALTEDFSVKLSILSAEPCDGMKALICPAASSETSRTVSYNMCCIHLLDRGFPFCQKLGSEEPNQENFFKRTNKNFEVT